MGVRGELSGLETCALGRSAVTFQLWGRPCTFLEGRGQAQLPQLWLHGVRELLQGPRVQAHGESGFVPSSGVVHLRVFREPPEGKEKWQEGRFPPGPHLTALPPRLSLEIRARENRDSVTGFQEPGTRFYSVPLLYKVLGYSLPGDLANLSLPTAPPEHLLVHFLLSAIGEKETNFTPQLLADLQNQSGVGSVTLEQRFSTGDHFAGPAPSSGNTWRHFWSQLEGGSTTLWVWRLKENRALSPPQAARWLQCASCDSSGEGSPASAPPCEGQRLT